MLNHVPLLTAEHVSQIDMEAIEAFNSNPKRRPEHRLHTRVGPFVPTSNIRKAPIVILLANPGYTDNLEETPDGCESFTVDGWPFGHLHPEAPIGARVWTRQRFRWLIDEFGDQFISQQIACAQLIPWASIQFHEGARLPSRNLILEEVKAAGARGALLVVMRIKRLWAPATKDAKTIFTNSVRSAYVSSGNLEKFDLVRERLLAVHSQASNSPET